MIPIGLLSEASETVLDASELVSAVETDSEETVLEKQHYYRFYPHRVRRRREM